MIHSEAVMVVIINGEVWFRVYEPMLTLVLRSYRTMTPVPSPNDANSRRHQAHALDRPQLAPLALPSQLNLLVHPIFHLGAHRAHRLAKLTVSSLNMCHHNNWAPLLYSQS